MTERATLAAAECVRLGYTRKLLSGASLTVDVSRTMKKCDHCGRPNDDAATNCYECGSSGFAAVGDASQFRSDDPIAAADWFVASLRKHGFNLDFSFQSLTTEIDRILGLPIFGYGKDVPSTPGGGCHEACLGAYIGETLSRLYGGEWQGVFDSRDPLPNGYLSCVRFGKYKFYPSCFIAFRLSNGEEIEGSFSEYLKTEVCRIEREREEGV
jgi:hypothetical protein